MREIFPGVLHWTTFHDGIGVEVSSYYDEPAGLLIDPRLPGQGLDEAFAGRAAPRQIALTTGLHARHAAQFAEHFSIPIRASRAADERRGGDPPVSLYRDGEDLAPGVTAVEIGALAPDEFALLLDVDRGAVALADALMDYGGGLQFVPDSLMGDDPAAVKSGLLAAFRELLRRDFAHLLLAHGDPIVGDGKAALQAFVETAQHAGPPGMSSP